MNLFGGDDNCDKQGCCDQIAAAIYAQTAAIEAILVKLFQGISANIDSQAKSLTRISRSIAKLADAYVQQQDYNINPILQQIITAIQVQLAETSVKLNLLQQLYTQISQEQVNIRSDITNIRQDVSNVQSQVTNIVQQGIGGPPQAPPSVAVTVSVAPVTTVVGPTINVDVPEPPPAIQSVSISVAQTQVGPSVSVVNSVENILPKIENLVNVAGAIAVATSDPTLIFDPKIDVRNHIEQNIGDINNTVSQWQKQSMPPAAPVGEKPPAEQPSGTGYDGLDPAYFPGAFKFAAAPSDWRDEFVSWGGTPYSALMSAPSLVELAQLVANLTRERTR